MRRFWFIPLAQLFAAHTNAWVYPEHREVALQAVASLDTQHRAVFDSLWHSARAGNEVRLCDSGADEAQSLRPSCIDWAALSAIAGDHSCSSRDMLHNTLDSEWILKVAAVGAKLGVDLKALSASADGSSESDFQRMFAHNRREAKRDNALRNADLSLLRADSEYVTRAGSNSAHFLLPRANAEVTVEDYARFTLREGSEINAVGVYEWYHLSAVEKGSRLAHETLSAPERNALARAALADEAFALHFLEDVFAAGHVVGSWGDVYERKGTHDYYNQNGLEVFTWGGGTRSIVLMGDARMRPQDAKVVAAAVRTSLEQVLDVATQGATNVNLPPTASAQADAFDVCRSAMLPTRPEKLKLSAEYRRYFVAALEQTPIPGLGPGPGAMPRFRSDVGFFVGVAAGIDGRVIESGFLDTQRNSGAVGGLELAVQAGVGLNGVMGQEGDGQVFVSLGYRIDTASTNQFTNSLPSSLGGGLSAAIPSRSGITTRIRMPFYLVPGDLVLLSPLYFFNRHAYTNMGLTAINGGLIPWQSGMATVIGRFQFVVGRELGVTFYGHDLFFAPPNTPSETPVVIRIKSTCFDLPVLEYRPFRGFSSRKSASLLFQLFAAADVPEDASVEYPAGAAVPRLHTIWSVGLRFTLDWRYYQ